MHHRIRRYYRLKKENSSSFNFVHLRVKFLYSIVFSGVVQMFICRFREYLIKNQPFTAIIRANKAPIKPIFPKLKNEIIN
jgi:hypothetical protein